MCCVEESVNVTCVGHVMTVCLHRQNANLTDVSADCLLEGAELNLTSDGGFCYVVDMTACHSNVTARHNSTNTVCISYFGSLALPAVGHLLHSTSSNVIYFEFTLVQRLTLCALSNSSIMYSSQQLLLSCLLNVFLNIFVYQGHCRLLLGFL